MIEIIKHSIRFVFFLIAQAFIFNQLEIGLGIQLMVYPLYIFLLPLGMNVFLLMLISFGLGFCIDLFSNTYGLHASSALVIAYGRSYLLKLFEPRDGFDPGIELTIYSIGYTWFAYVFGTFLLVHTMWFFLIEQFKWSEFWYVVLKTVLGVPMSLIICVLLQFLFFKKPVKR